ncbi:MAG: ParB N-terminal domain-containing protein [Magnetococcales bacterium]|nr:ParB N-terminal domain-containing protein [Magnetococcales bacterium]
MKSIPIDNIVVGKRLRQVRPEAVEALAQSIRELGLLNPVLVTPLPDDDGQGVPDRFRLIAGNHRLEACRRLGMHDIAANVVTVEELDQRLAEIDENLCRSELTHLEMAEHLSERKALYETKYPETRHGACGGGNNGVGTRMRAGNEIISFSADTAQKTGATARNIQQAVRRANDISQEVRDAIRDVASIADNSLELDALAGLEEPEQMEAVQAVLDNKARSIREVIRQKEIKTSSPTTRAPQEAPKDGDDAGGPPVPGDIQDWKRKAKEASGLVMAQKERIRTLNKDRTALKARIAELETRVPEPMPQPLPDLLAEVESWKCRALQAEDECINLQHRLEQVELGANSVPANRGVALRGLLDDLETGLCHRPGDFFPETLLEFRSRFLRLVSAVEDTMRRNNQPFPQSGE